jgi:hypothetical protein
MTPTVRNARAEAQALLPEGHSARVLEPSPPADTDPDWYARDEAAVGEVDPGSVVVTPTTAGSFSWDDLADEDPKIAEFAREHWLGNRKPLGPVPGGLPTARADLNRLVYYVISPARKAVNGKIALRWSRGGFGTPFFGADVQVRVEGTELVVQEGDSVRSEPISTLANAAKFVEVGIDPELAEHGDVPPLGDDHLHLAVGDDHVAFLSDWFGFTTAVLEETRLLGGPGDDVSRVQLWAEHFDPAVELGSAEAGQRASFGGSPGDSSHDEPYLYVASWGEIDRSNPFWNDESFNGGSMSYAELLDGDDAYSTALDFFRRGADALGIS